MRLFVLASVDGEWLRLLSIPLTAAFVGYVTKLLAIKMMFWPERFVGLGPIGWQGMIPRRTAKFASVAADALLGRLIDPRELLDSIDPQVLAASIEEPLIELSDDVAREILSRYYPELWDRLPEATRRLVLARVRKRAPDVVARLLERVREDVDTVFDPRLAVVENMVTNKQLMVRLVREIALPEMGFMVRMGVLFGFAIGTVQMVLWGLTHNHLLLPLFGAFVGFFSDWIAMTMIFVPRTPRRYLGVFPWHGLFFKRREELSRSYARMASDALLTPAVLLRAVLDGPLADRLFAMVAREAEHALKEEEGVAGPVLDLAIGSARYLDLRDAVRARAPEAATRIEPRLEEFARSTFDIETLVGDTMVAMDEDEYEAILRPMFKDDEWVVIVVGGILGAIVGELQVLILTSV
jgi:uncharacterized membrane protein YheB (UPF0754 family)